MTDAMDAYDLTGKVAVITGGASGIGAATAELLASRGAAIVAGDLNLDGAAETAARISDAGGRAVAQAANVTQRADVDALVARGVDEFGGVDIMCNIAGTMFPGLLYEVADEVFEAGLDLNLRGVHYGCQAAVTAMRARGSGCIINVSSAAIDAPAPNLGVYSLTKAAVAMYTKTLATEVGEFGIRVNAIAPGATITPFTTWRMYRPDGTLDQEVYDAFVEQMRSMSPLGTVGEAIDQAHLILYLCSDAGRWVTGNIHRVNGGQAMPW